MQIDLKPDLSLLAIVAIFIVNYLIVRRFFIKPVNAILEEREVETRSAEKLHEEALSRFNEATAQIEAQMHAAKREAAQMRDRFRGEAAAYRQSVIDRTGAETRQIIGAADEDLSRSVATARESIVRDAGALAKVAAERLLGRTV